MYIDKNSKYWVPISIYQKHPSGHDHPDTFFSLAANLYYLRLRCECNLFSELEAYCSMWFVLVDYWLLIIAYTYFDCVIFEVKSQVYPPTHSPYPPMPNRSTPSLHWQHALPPPMSILWWIFVKIFRQNPNSKNWFLISDFQWPKFSI